MSALLDQLEQNIRARRLFHRDQAILIAVSGGVDSMVLLHALNARAATNGWRLNIAHLNHELRGRSSDADQRLVVAMAKRLGLPVLSRRVDVRRFAKQHKLSLEMAARQVRHDFLANTASQAGISTIALAHHADDQVELFFLRLLRGTGGEGLAGMKWRNPSPSDPAIELVRPLLDQPKSTLREYAAREKIPFRDDATNALLDIQRNRIRHELLPLVRSHYQPALDKTILRLMEIVGAEAKFVREAAEEWLRLAVQVRSPEPEVPRNSEIRNPYQANRIAARSPAGSFKARSFRPSPPQPPACFDRLPIAVQRGCVQQQLLRLGLAPDFDLIEQLRINADTPVSVKVSRLLAARGGRAGSTRGVSPARNRYLSRLSQTKAERATRSRSQVAPIGEVFRDPGGMLHLAESRPPEFNSTAVDLELDGAAGEVQFAGARFRWRLTFGHARLAVHRPGFELFDADKVGGRIVLRHWQPGDRFQPIGMATPVKLQDFFTNQKVLRRRRHELVVAATAVGEVFWVEGLRISERFKLTEQTDRCLQWRWRRA